MEDGNHTSPISFSVQTPLLHKTNGTHQQTHNHELTPEENVDIDVDDDVVVVIDEEIDDTQLDKTLQRLEFYLRILGFDQSSVLRFVLSWSVFIFVCAVLPVVILELTHCSACDDYQVRDFEYEILTSQLLLAAASLICLSHNLNRKGIRKFLFVDRYRGHTSRSFLWLILLGFLSIAINVTPSMLHPEITGVNGRVTFLNGGNFAVSSLVQVIETLLCLHAGTKISHRAQGVGAIACKWHALVTCKSFEGTRRSISMGSLSSNCSESDLEAMDGITVRNHSHFASVSSYNKRQSFGMSHYLFKF
ncbi:hypothetical protein KSS87_003333 [Heliosperma pusillum]|nr:hypothetical protein KSS87_003333 [Heliosperma pusillum]